MMIAPMSGSSSKQFGCSAGDPFITWLLSAFEGGFVQRDNANPPLTRL